MNIGRGTYGVEGVNGINFIQGGNDYNNAIFTIGKYCSVAPHTKVYLGRYHHSEWITTYDHFDYNNPTLPRHGGDIIIGNDVWICDGVTIMGGVTIGDGAIIACNTHVVHNVEPYSIHGGNPNKLIKYRFSKDIIEKLLKIRWWDKDEHEISKIVPILCSSNFEELFKIYSI